MITRNLVKAILFVSPLIGMSAAQAVLVDCTASSTTNANSKVKSGAVTAVNACQYISPENQSNIASIANINAAGFFGTNTWAANGGQVQVNPPNNQSGTWAISGANFATFDYMIVFKDGDDTNLIGFLFNELFAAGTWTTPFTNPPFTDLNPNQKKNVSHYTIVQRRGKPTEMPEPGIVALMGLGLAGFAAARRRSAKK